MFFGTSTNELGGETEVEDSSGQTALFVCSKISSEMKNLQQELRGLTSAVRHLQSQQTESQQENGKKNGKEVTCQRIAGKNALEFYCDSTKF